MATITIAASESGRLWADDPSAWARLCTPEGCPMCGEERHPEWLLAETDVSKVSAAPEAVLPGYACVVSKVHVVEPFDLPNDEQMVFFADCMTAARGLAQLFAPAKMNYEIHGNTVPHLHMHLFPRTAGDVHVGYPNHCRTRFTRSGAELDQMRRAVQGAFANRGSR
jgi:diadenosine tetraphosphate (Ap4A) HIT family hydrolase